MISADSPMDIVEEFSENMDLPLVKICMADFVENNLFSAPKQLSKPIVPNAAFFKL